MKDAKVEPSCKKRDLTGSWIALLSVLAAFAIFFHKSVFFGKPLAKLGDLAHIDALFNPALKQAIVDLGRDPSGYLIFFPNGHFEDSMWWRLVPPLWNPLVACGYPLLGDPQSLLHSPAHLLRLFSSPEAYQLGLLMEIALGGIGMVLLCRFYKLSIPASILSALAFVLSPRILVQVDISGNECFFPFVFLGFAWLAEKPSLVRAALAGVLCAFIAYAAHPETCFFAVLFAAILCFFSMALSSFGKQAGLKEQLGLIFADGIKSFLLLLLTALVSLCLAAPLVFPFLEFMRNAYIYKDAIPSASFFVSWTDFTAGVYANRGNEPYFIGSVAALLAPLGLTGKRNRATAFFLTLILGFFICFPQGQIMQLLSQKPISYVATLYGIPDLLLILSLLAGMGLDLLFERLSKVRMLVLVFSAALVFYYPLDNLYRLSESHAPGFIWRSASTLLTATSVLGLVACGVCLLFALRLSGSLKFVLAVGLAVLNFASLALVDRNILPVNPKFSLAPPAPLAYLQAHAGRCLATGTNLFLPNTNLDYGLEDFRCFSPLLPRRYKTFLQEAGGLCYNLYFYAMPDRCSNLLDLAGVKYVLSRSAVRGSETGIAGSIDLKEPVAKRLMPGLRILQARLSFDPLNSQVDADMKLRVHDLCNFRYALQYVVIDNAGKELWSSRESLLSPADGPQHTTVVHESWPVPSTAEFPVSVGLRIKDTWVSAAVSPEGGVARAGDAFLLCTVAKKYSDAKTSGSAGSSKPEGGRHYNLNAEFAQEGCRIYENQRSLPCAYLINNVRHFKPGDSESVWKRLHDERFDCHSELLLEDGLETKVEESLPALFKAVAIKRSDCNTVLAECSADSDCYFVLTEAFYPGWKCLVDGRESQIFPANYLFRAVKLSEGHHSLKFCFVPASYYNALLVSAFTFSAVMLLAFLGRKKTSGNNEAI